MNLRSLGPEPSAIPLRHRLSVSRSLHDRLDTCPTKRETDGNRTHPRRITTSSACRYTTASIVPPGFGGLGYSRKVVVAVDAVVPAGVHAASLETDALTRTGTGPRGRASQRVACCHERSAHRASRASPTGNPCGVYSSARKQKSSSNGWNLGIRHLHKGLNGPARN